MKIPKAAELKRNLKIAISCVYYAVTRPWLLLAEWLGLSGKARLVILYYHDIPADKRAGFAAQLDLLSRHATIVGADWRGQDLSGHACAITFDDAFVSVFDNALPELAARRMPCTIFVPAGYIGRKPGWAEFDSAATEVVSGDNLIRSLRSPLVTIGSHSVSHPRLSRIPRDLALAEVASSRPMLSALTGHDVRLMAFPFGNYDQEVVAMCRGAGYDFVYGIEPSVVDARAHRFLRGRVAVEPDDGRLEFFLKISGGYSWMIIASALKRIARKALRSGG